jgi:hypothetical protein
MTNVSIRTATTNDGSIKFHYGINDIHDLAFLGINDLHDAHRWYNKNVQRVPHNAIRVLRVAECEFTTHIAPDGRRSGLNSKTGNWKLLPKLRKNPVSTNQYAEFLMNMGRTVGRLPL